MGLSSPILLIYGNYATSRKKLRDLLSPFQECSYLTDAFLQLLGLEAVACTRDDV